MNVQEMITDRTWNVKGQRRRQASPGEPPTEGQGACKSLLSELERPNPDRSVVTAEAKRIQEIRQKAKLELAGTQQHGRAVLTQEQQDIVVLMGYLHRETPTCAGLLISTAGASV